VGYLLDQMTQSLAALRRSCGIALALAAVLALVAGRIMARRSLQPVDTMTDTAKRIGANRLGDRLPRSGTGDELDRLAETLNDMLARIETHVKRLQQFTADVSHELRSPLAALKGSSEVALSGARSAAELRRVIEDNVEHYNRLTRIAEDLLLLARADAGENILRTDRIRLDEAIDDVVDLYAPLAADRRIELLFNDRQEISIRADGERLRQVLGNLIDNAIKYTQGPGRVTVCLATTDGHARIVVSDTGVGIPPEDMPHVFDRFYRADRARASQGAGSAGLGLSICRSIVEAHGGRIRVESTPGRGTTVIVLLPLKSDHTGRPAF
jgi:heavy metal sensor kinase